MNEENEELKTVKRYTDDNGEYLESRKTLHTEIVRYFLKSPPSNKESSKDAVLLGGGSNSGKSTVAEDLPQGLVIIDSDEIKNHIPDYEDYKIDYPKFAAFYVHDESSDISNQLLNATIDEERSFVYDGTMKNYEKYKGIIRKLREKDYFITMIIVDIPIELAYLRNKARFEATGRAVPEDILEETHHAIPKSFIELKDLVDEYYLYDTRDENPPVLVAQKTQELGEKVFEEEYYQEFLDKHKK